ncbi:hypothetical protein P8605_08340 [Streptomyces sp. T-3]|nr:hypothetical protein [Streptomyces sp. T-3]
MRIRTITTVGAIATTLMLGAALPAVADADQSAEPTTSHSATAADRAEARAGGVWLYQAKNYKEGKIKFTRDDMKFSNNKFDNGYNVHDRASSMKNTSRKTADVYSNTWKTGRYEVLTPGEKIPRLSQIRLGNDAADSIDFR